MEETEEPLDPATPELFNGAHNYSSDGRVTPDDTSSLDGLTSAGAYPVKRKKRGRPPLYLTGEPLESWTDADKGIQYKVGDFIFFDGRKAGDLFRIGTILAIRKTKKQRTLASIRLYFKAAQLPEGVYQRLMEDRNSENLGGFGEFMVANPVIKEREVFKSEKSEVIRSHSVRGKCTVIQLTDVQSVRRFVPVTDTYFTLLGYNPDTRRLATIQGEIRIGSSHQAKLPECKPTVSPSSRPCRAMPAGIGGGDNGEEKLWTPGNIHVDELEAYLKATQSMVASFTNMSERKSADEGVAIAQRDENTQLALNHLHRSCYNKNDAVAEFVKSVPLMRSIDKRWEEDDSKKFMKGLRVFGKNFFTIRKEFLPEKETKELIEYYYYWKKTPISTVPNRTGRRQKSRKAGGSTSKAASSAGDNSSESEEADSSESYTCFRCDTESTNQWHYVDQHGFVCESCKLNYRKYGDENGEKIPEYLFRPVEPASAYRRLKKKVKSEPELMDNEDLIPDPASEPERKSPSASSTSSSTSNKQTPRKRRSPGKAKRSIMSVNGSASPTLKTEPGEGPPAPSADSESEAPLSEVLEKKKKLEQSSPDSLASELSRGNVQSRDADAEDTGNMGDVEQDDNSTTNSPPSPCGSEDSLTNEVIQPDNSVAVPCHELILQRKHANFVRCLKREDNSCCRIDVHYVPPPGSAMAKKREDRLRKPLAIAQPTIAPPTSHSQSGDVKIKAEPVSVPGSTGVSDIIRHTSQSHHPMRIVPPSSASLSRDPQRMTPTHAQAVAMQSVHHSNMSHSTHTSSHRSSTTPSQRVTPRSQSGAPPAAEQMLAGVGPNTPALLQLSQMAGRQQLAQHQSIADEMARFAAYAAATSAPTSAAAAMGFPPGMDSVAMSLQQYRMMRSMLPTDQIDRLYQPEIRERLDMALKAQDLENHQHKMLLAQGGQAGSAPVDSKAFFEAQMMEMQRKLQQGMPPGSMMPPGGLPIGLLPPTSMASSGASEMMARERERMQKLGLFGPGAMLTDPMAQMASSPVERLSAERLNAAERLSAEQQQRLAAGIANTAHAHTHTHTHLHLHQQAEQAAQQAAQAQAAAAAMASQNPFLAQQILQGIGAAGDPAVLARLAASSGVPYGALPLGFPGGHPMGLNIPTSGAGDMPAQLMAAALAAQQAAGGQEMNPREMLAMQQMLAANPAAMAQHEAFQRQFLQQERDRQLSHHMPPH